MTKLIGKSITIWGDSILKGVVWDEHEKKYKVLKNSSIESFAELTGCSVKNNAYFGMTSTKALNRIKTSISKQALGENDIVILEFGGNDCDFNWSEVSDRPHDMHQPKTTIENFKASLQNIIGMFQEKGVTPVLMNLPPLEPEFYFNWISRGLNKDNILNWLEDVSKIYRWQEAYNNAVEFVARQCGCKIINVRDNFLISSNYRSQFCADGIHPSENGHKKILESLLAFSF